MNSPFTYPPSCFLAIPHQIGREIRDFPGSLDGETDGEARREEVLCGGDELRGKRGIPYGGDVAGEGREGGHRALNMKQRDIVESLEKGAKMQNREEFLLPETAAQLRVLIANKIHRGHGYMPDFLLNDIVRVSFPFIHP